MICNLSVASQGLELFQQWYHFDVRVRVITPSSHKLNINIGTI